MLLELNIDTLDDKILLIINNIDKLFEDCRISHVINWVHEAEWCTM